MTTCRFSTCALLWSMSLYRITRFRAVRAISRSRMFRSIMALSHTTIWNSDMPTRMINTAYSTTFGRERSNSARSVRSDIPVENVSLDYGIISYNYMEQRHADSHDKYSVQHNLRTGEIE